MYYLKTEQFFDAAHFLAGYQGKCKNLHGHRWKVIVEISGEKLKENGQMRGMIVDFGDLKREVKMLVEELDHTFIYETGSLKAHTILALKEEGFQLVEVPFRPTAENFSYYFYEKMQKKGYSVYQVTVYETPENCAVYRKDSGYNERVEKKESYF